MSVRVKLADSPAEWAGAVGVRIAVFVDEQRVPLPAEMDEHDRVALHAVAVIERSAAELKALERVRQPVAIRAVAQAGKYLPMSLAGTRVSGSEAASLAPVVGTARLVGGAGGRYRLGRLAVYPRWRGKGVGTRLLRLLEEAALARGANRLYLHAQMHAEPFYAKHGYTVDGPRAEFLEDGIPHVRMSKPLSPEM
jgi:predicted GNAT family N-acyltransferase